MTSVEDRAIVDALTEHLRDERGDLLTAASLHLRDAFPLTPRDRRSSIARRAVAAVEGCGPLEHHLADPGVREVMVIAGCEVWVDDERGLRRVDSLEQGEAERIIERILLPLGRRIDRLHPIVDARLPDGSRVCAVVPPVAVDGPVLCIRRLARWRHGPPDFGPGLEAALRLVAARRNIVVSGGSSSGKTTLLGLLCDAVGPGERLVTIEDVTELSLGASHVVRLECRPPNAEGLGAIDACALVRAALRLRPDRLVVGEVRGAEVIDMLAALHSGHDGSMTTCHANSAADALDRLSALVLRHHVGWTRADVEGHVRTAIDAVIHVRRLADGTREIAEILELDAAGADRTTFARGPR